MISGAFGNTRRSNVGSVSECAVRGPVTFPQFHQIMRVDRRVVRVVATHENCCGYCGHMKLPLRLKLMQKLRTHYERCDPQNSLAQTWTPTKRCKLQLGNLKIRGFRRLRQAILHRLPSELTSPRQTLFQSFVVSRPTTEAFSCFTIRRCTATKLSCLRPAVPHSSIRTDRQKPA